MENNEGLLNKCENAAAQDTPSKKPLEKQGTHGETSWEVPCVQVKDNSYQTGLKLLN